MCTFHTQSWKIQNNIKTAFFSLKDLREKRFTHCIFYERKKKFFNVKRKSIICTYLTSEQSIRKMRKMNEFVYAIMQLRYFCTVLRYRGTRGTSLRRSFNHGQCYVLLPHIDKLQRFAKHVRAPRRMISPEGAASPFAFVKPSIRQIITLHVCTPHLSQLSPSKRTRRSMLSIRSARSTSAEIPFTALSGQRFQFF